MDRIDQAFTNTPRANFLPDEVVALADQDHALPIMQEQTNSQPSTVRMMLGWLAVNPGDKVLDVGSGSGWTTALLSRLVGDEGRVIAVERIDELVKFGRNNCKKLGIDNVVFHKAGKKFGWPKGAPYNRILVSASADEIPSDLVNQLAPNGKMIIPVQNDIAEIDKDEDGELKAGYYYGFRFVPLIKNK